MSSPSVPLSTSAAMERLVSITDKHAMASCSSCGAALRIDRGLDLLVCEYCGSQEESPAVIARIEVLGESARACPVCAIPLSDSRLECYRLLFRGCHGMLIDMNLFALVIEAAREAEGRVSDAVLSRRQNPRERTLDCPACRKPMLSHVYAGPGNLVIDTCEECLVNWLDAGELRRIARAPSGPRTPRAGARMSRHELPKP